MKLKTLAIHNIASIEDATIDFASEPLASTDLFLICGPTGSGKSTILDAICLALFNNTPRIKNSVNDNIDLLAEDEDKKKEKVKDVLHLVRKNAPEAWVTLSFEGNDGRECVADWRVRRKIKRGKQDAEAYESESLQEKLKRDVVKQWTLTDGDGITYEKVTEVEEHIQDIIKMNFDQFCKTTMLAQGDFTKFLSSTSDEKAAILEKLVGTEKYAQVGAVINQRTRETKNKVDVLTQEVANITFLSDEVKEQMQQMIAEARTAIEAANEQKNRIDVKLKWLNDSIRIQRDIHMAQQSIEQAEERAWTYYLRGQGAIAYVTQQGIKMKGECEELRKQIEGAEAKKTEAEMRLHQMEDQQKELMGSYREQEELAKTAEGTYEKSKELYDKAFLSLQDHAKALRSKVQVGDSCPVCGQTITSLLTDDFFMEALQPLKQQYEADKEALTRQQAALREARQQMDKLAQQTMDFRRQQLTPISQQISALSSDWQRKEQQLSQWRIEIRAGQDCMVQVQKTFLDWHPQAAVQPIPMTDSQLSQLWQALQAAVNGKIKATTQYETAMCQHAALAANPLEEGDSAETLQQQVQQLTAGAQQHAQEIGRIQSELAQDERNKQLQGEKKIRLEELTNEWAEWKTLDQYLGSTDGKNFRNVANSFILGDLLEKANVYLESITGRYILFCNPGTLTIMMRDTYQGGAIRPTNTLSGGESFIISLSLALGLSSMQSVGFEVDTLFIDEGFGTLSPEFLDPVITSLKRLYEQYGRRVGIISHVETLRRIPVTIEVSREGNAASKVEVRD